MFTVVSATATAGDQARDQNACRRNNMCALGSSVPGVAFCAAKRGHRKIKTTVLDLSFSSSEESESTDKEIPVVDGESFDLNAVAGRISNI